MREKPLMSVVRIERLNFLSVLQGPREVRAGDASVSVDLLTLNQCQVAWALQRDGPVENGERGGHGTIL